MTQTASDTPEDQKIHDLPVNNVELPKTNGHSDETAAEGEPPSKRRRVSESVPPSKRKLESPPWKKSVAEGPSSFTQNGRRKSGRVNEIPLELQPPSTKRQTRGAVQKTYSAKSKNAIANGHSSPFQARDIHTSVKGAKRAVPNTTSSSQQSPKPPAKLASPKRPYRKSMPSEQPATPVRSSTRTAAPKDTQLGAVQPRQPKNRRSGRVSATIDDEEDSRSQILKHENTIGPSPKSALARIKLRVKPPSLPIVHPGLILPRPRRYTSLNEFFDHAADIPIDEGGLYHSEEPPEYNEEQVAKDVAVILRAEEAAQPGGVLAPGISTAYQPEASDPMPQQYSHQDHMVRAAIEFRRLMQIEQKKHRAAAKRLAEACRDEYRRRQPKTAEQLELELYESNKARYLVVIRALRNTWDNVRAEVNRRRLVEWEVQEQARVRKALSEAVDISTQKLQARRAQTESEDDSDDSAEDGKEGGADSDAESTSDVEERESNMSSSDSEADDDQPKADNADDEQLTVEQLREKYAGMEKVTNVLEDEEMPDAEEEPPDEIIQEPKSDVEIFDDSDESVDMDDDMGSSDEGQDSEDDEDGDAGSDDDGEESTARDLLGFLAPSELKNIELGQVRPSESNVDNNEEAEEEEKDVDDADEISLVPDPSIAVHVSDKQNMEEREDADTLMDQGQSTIESTTPPEDDELNGELEKDDNGNGDKNFSKVDKKAEVIPNMDSSSPPNATVDGPVSPDRSSQPTPRTTETKPSEIDSASSVDAHQVSRQVTQSATPQPNNQLKTPVPFLLRGTLREYQHYGLDWLAGLYANNTNGILADEMGLGKTIQTIALLAHLACEHEAWGPHLVIVPTSVILNWEMEFKKWCPGFKILTYYGTQEERKRKRQGWKTEDAWNVCITSYQIIIHDQQVFKRRRWHYMILDEAHNIKNFNSQRWQVMLTFNTRARLLLTGTPLQNNLNELWSLLYFLMPPDGTTQGVGGFADLKEFQDWFKKPSEQILEHGRDHMDDEAREIISKLHRLLRPYLLRRLKADVEKQMPAKYEHVEFCRLSKRQRELYDGFLSRGDTRETLAGGNYLSIINCLMQLRKVCNHPDLFVDRPIMTSFPMDKSAIADFEIKELLVRRRLLREDPMKIASLEFLNLVPTKHERLSASMTAKSAHYSAQRQLMELREAQRKRADNALTHLDPTTAKSNLVYLESASRWGRFEELQHAVYLNALRRQQKPMYGTELIERLTLGFNEGPLRPQPKRRDQMLTWLETRSPTFMAMVPSVQSRSQSLKSTIQKFACVTPPVIARDMSSLILGPKGVQIVQQSVDKSVVDPFHEARMRLSIQFPDKRLLQYDCGKLQTLDKLLRKLQAGGHRALIFTQMTKVLDILEQFLNIHGHKYLRLDGSTKVEQRQILTDRFNNDTRILAFILSSRSGGLGINLTGADTVIFYDLDWNPAMDKQCQDRCHRIGQTRDVHIYRLVSEHTIEANILRKANQKRMLDDVVIQEGEFTTDYFNKVAVRDVIEEEPDLMDGDAAANAAMDRVLGGPTNDNDMTRVLAQAEDREDVAAAKIAEREIVQTDAADFDENAATAAATPAGIGTPQETEALPNTEAPQAAEVVEVIEEDEVNAWGEQIHSTDDYMLDHMTAQLKDTPIELPRDKSKSKKGRDHRSHRIR